MSHTVDLGSSIFNATKSGQCLLLKASATFLLPKEHTVLPMSLEQILNSRSVWITKGPELVLYICIEGPCDGLGPMFTLLNNSVGILSEARLWFDLGLLASTKSCEYKPGPDHTMTLHFSLSVQEDFQRTVKGMHGKVPRPIRRCILVDPQPPPGIATVTLSNIQISLRYLSSTSACFPQTGLSGANVGLEDTMMTAEDGVKIPKSDETSSTPWLGYPTSPPFTSPLFTPELHPLDTGAEFPHPPASASIIKRNRVSAGNDCRLHGLLDYAIRNLIASRPSKVMRGIDLINSRGEPGPPKLSDIAPSVFSRGYHDRIRQRAAFIPAVAKSITLIVSRSTAEHMRREVTSVEAFFRRNYESNPTQPIPDLRSMIKCLLWTSLQKGVQDPKAARKLSPITQADSGEADHSSMLEDQLSLSWSDDILSASPETDYDFTDIDADDDDADDFARSLFEEELCSAFSGSINSDSDDLMDAVSRFSISDIGEEEVITESSPAQHKQGNTEDPYCQLMKSVYGGFGTMSPIITGYAQQNRRGLAFSNNKNNDSSPREPYDNNKAYQLESPSSSAGFPSSPLTFNEEMSPHLESDIDIEIETGSDLESIGSFEEELVGEEEEYLFDNDEDGDEEMLY